MYNICENHLLSNLSNRPINRPKGKQTKKSRRTFRPCLIQRPICAPAAMWLISSLSLHCPAYKIKAATRLLFNLPVPLDINPTVHDDRKWEEIAQLC